MVYLCVGILKPSLNIDQFDCRVRGLKDSKIN